MIKESRTRKIFNVCNIIMLASVAIICILPFVHLFAVSLSSSLASQAGDVGLLPKDFNLEAYKYLLQKKEFFKAMGVSVVRMVLGTGIGVSITILVAYPLSKEKKEFKARPFLSAFFIITLFFGGGMIPTYMVIQKLNLIDSIWVLVLPIALNVWNVVLLMNFFRRIPKDLEEAARIDGANQLYILLKVFLPIALPAIATIVLFTSVGHWNSWFDGMLYLNTPSKYPLQTYLSTIVIDSDMTSSQVMTPEQLLALQNVGEKNLQAAQIFIGALPILLVYPFLQRFFIKGIVVGSVKG